MGYEFQTKELRAKFKKTPLGKKYNKALYVSLLVFIFSAIVAVILRFALEISLTELIWITIIPMIVACYFDGKRDGAIMQFKESKNKK